jgi:hypothetical protein
MKLIKALSVFIIILVITNVTLTNRTLDEGLMISNLTNDLDVLQNQNTILRSQVALAGSIGGLTTKLSEAGFVESPKIILASR